MIENKKTRGRPKGSKNKIHIRTGRRKTVKEINEMIMGMGIEVIPQYQKVNPTYENLIELGDSVCSFFGCPVTLSSIEKLCGDRCLKHMNIQKNIFLNGKL